jgi:copper chaperone CopZ
MKRIALNVSKDICAECSMALRRFIGKMDGVDSIDVGDGQVIVKFDEATMDEDFLRKLTNESMEKLGYKIQE